MYLHPPANEPAFEIGLIVIKSSFKGALERFKKKTQDLQSHKRIRGNQKSLLKGCICPAIKIFWGIFVISLSTPT